MRLLSNFNSMIAFMALDRARERRREWTNGTLQKTNGTGGWNKNGECWLPAVDIFCHVQHLMCSTFLFSLCSLGCACVCMPYVYVFTYFASLTSLLKQTYYWAWQRQSFNVSKYFRNLSYNVINIRNCDMLNSVYAALYISSTYYFGLHWSRNGFIYIETWRRARSNKTQRIVFINMY